ncbi:MAG: 16S rRNA processing protein RimM [Chloroflexi bacterium]|nr:16S rRNA processing protein RimM [Chloroflexota bacterium]
MTNQSNNPREPYFLVLGKVVRPHGIRGELRMQIITRLPELFEDLDVVYLGSDKFDRRSATRYKVTRLRQERDVLLLAVDGMTDRNMAESLRGKFVMIPLRDALPLEEDEIYLFEIVGMSVYTDTDEYLGDVAEIMETGANDVYLLRGGNRGDVLIPDTDEVIQSIDRANRKIIITPLIGLLPGEVIDDDLEDEPDVDGDEA